MKDLLVICPEITLLILSCTTLIVDLWVRARWMSYLLSQASILITLGVCYFFQEKASAFGQQLIVDPFSQGLKIFILGLMFFIFLYSRHYVTQRKIPRGEFYLLALFSTLGMMVLVSANSLLMIYLGLELLSLPLYALVALHKKSDSAEAAMKYFMMGALASGILLYGISLLYGVTGGIQLDQINTFVQTASSTQWHIALLGLIFVLCGVAFKLGAVPFHMWIPDVYQGAPTNITLLISSAPKIAAFGMSYRLLHDAFANFAPQWSQFLVVLAVLSLALGNVAAIVQTNVKRLLAYSAIGQIGFLLLGLLVAPQMGYTAATYYILIYTIVVLGAFGILLLLSQHGFEAQTFEDLKGLAQCNPWLAFIMLLVAFSLAGVPPTVGFYAKFMILKGLVQSGLPELAAIAVIFSVIGAFYYLKIVKAMYFEAPSISHSVGGPLDFRVALSLNGLAILGLGIFPAPFFMFCQQLFN